MPASALAVLGACVACPAVGAQEAPPPAEVLVAEARTDEPSVRLQVRTSSLPRLEAQDSGFQAPRVDVSLTPFSSNGTGVGPVLGMSSFRPASAGVGLQAQQRASIDLGLRWTQMLHSQRQIDVTAWRRMNTPDDAYTLVQLREPAVYGARVEMKLTPSKGPLALDRGFIGLQLESGAKISIKRKDGRPMIYYRTTF